MPLRQIPLREISRACPCIARLWRVPCGIDDITLAVNIGCDDDEYQRTHASDSKNAAVGLAKVDFSSDRYFTLTVKSILKAYAHIEPPGTRKGEICIENEKLKTGDALPFSPTDLKLALAEVPGKWELGCTNYRARLPEDQNTVVRDIERRPDLS
ncbi:hypothetical protein FB451DRAFT_1166973 [Mycena latifolia]|nr:hypothetical protein FB451DRAFT_1166973 [Mycena latifolia]